MNDKKTNANVELIAVILVRGRINLTQPQANTLDMLNLLRKNHCIVKPATPPSA